MNIRFAYWVPNVSGGLVVSKIPQKTDWSFEYNRWLALEAEKAGFDYGLVRPATLPATGRITSWKRSRRWRGSWPSPSGSN